MKKILVLALALFAFVVPSAAARPGALDSSFGREGKVAWPLNLGATWKRAATAVAKFSDGGAIALVGDNLIALNRDGTPRRRFLRFGLTHGPLFLGAQSMVDVTVDRRDRVLVLGTVTSATDPARQGGLADESIFLTRYLENGYPDPSFGRRGSLITDLGLRPPTIDDPGSHTLEAPALTRAGALALDARGRIVLSGVTVKREGACSVPNRSDFTSDYEYRDGIIARLRMDGGLDASFGQGGLITIPESLSVEDLLVSRSGDAFAMRAPASECRSSSAVERVVKVTAGGLLKKRLGDDREFFEADRTSLAVDRRGRALVLWRGSQIAEPGRGLEFLHAGRLRRLLPSGRQDRGFGQNGTVTLVFGKRGFNPSQVLVDRGGRIYVAGTPPASREAPGSFLVCRLDPDGHVDRRFGRGGWARADWGRNVVVGNPSATLVGGGRLLLAGPMSNPRLRYDTGAGFARFLIR
ncbi:MAG TPA: hypothetical protein VG448_09580 [Solirubrobacterales bacterium]|nr:hypothetical protein [Solirubrobacterales bacterium]